MSKERTLVSKTRSVLTSIKDDELYYHSKMPSPVDEEIGSMCREFVTADAGERQAAVGALSLHEVQVLHSFALRMTMLCLRDGSQEHLWQGLVAIVMMDEKEDYREVWMSLPAFIYSAEQLGMDPRELFQAAARLTNNKTVVRYLTEFVDRDPYDRSLQAMGQRAIDTPAGIVYWNTHWGEIRAGWLERE